MLKTLEEGNKMKIAAGFINGNIVVYDLDLILLKQITLKTINEEVI